MVHQMKRKINPIVKFIEETEGRFKLNVNGQTIKLSKTATITHTNNYLYIADSENNCKSIIKLESIDSVISMRE